MLCETAYAKYCMISIICGFKIVKLPESEISMVVARSCIRVNERMSDGFLSCDKTLWPKVT